MKKTICVLLCFLVLLSLAVLGKEKEPEGRVIEISEWFDEMPRIDISHVRDGHNIALHVKFDGYPNATCQFPKSVLIYIMYFDGDPEEETSSKVTVTRSVGEDGISGDCGEYSENGIMRVRSTDVRLQGDDGLVRRATWKWKDYWFSIDAERGLSREAVGKAVGEILALTRGNASGRPVSQRNWLLFQR